MAYEIYKKKLSIDDYFQRWDDERLIELTNDLKKNIYEKYLVKCEVFQRDKFECQHRKCKTRNDTLTMHHVKFQKNGGDHKLKNCVTLCNTCHKGFHAGKHPLAMKDNKSLPSNIRNHTFQLDINDEINWKLIKNQMKKFRKTIHDESGLKISWEQIEFLMKWLELYYKED